MYTERAMRVQKRETIATVSKTAAAAAKSLQSCPNLCDPIDRSPPGFPVPGILQARMLEWVAISFSNAWKWKVKVKLLSHVQLLATPWTTAYQGPPSMGFSRQEYWSGVPLPSTVSKLTGALIGITHTPVIIVFLTATILQCRNDNFTYKCPRRSCKMY